jgi:hypothetical protein
MCRINEFLVGSSLTTMSGPLWVGFGENHQLMETEANDVYLMLMGKSKLVLKLGDCIIVFFQTINEHPDLPYFLNFYQCHMQYRLSRDSSRHAIPALAFGIIRSEPYSRPICLPIQSHFKFDSLILGLDCELRFFNIACFISCHDSKFVAIGPWHGAEHIRNSL